MSEAISQLETVRATLTKRIAQNDVDIPLLPEVAQKVLGLTQDADSDASQLATVIQSDPTLAAHILRIANSPAYSPNGNISSLQQAVSRLGMIVLAEVAIAASVNATLFHAPGFEKRIQQIWRDSLLTGLWSKEVARACRRNVDTAFLCGLLHNIGRPMLLQWVTNGESVLNETDTLELEDALFLEANRAMVQAWQLPDIVLQGITQYPMEVKTMPEIAVLVRAGRMLCQWSAAPDSELSEHPDYKSIVTVLNLYPDTVANIKMQYNDVHATLEVMRG
ncbi:MAG: HDOD domain-containing protein [Reinekea sp.]|nr:HDOD domain-containing protein [Reinekea sp.]